MLKCFEIFFKEFLLKCLFLKFNVFLLFIIFVNVLMKVVGILESDLFKLFMLELFFRRKKIFLINVVSFVMDVLSFFICFLNIIFIYGMKFMLLFMVLFFIKFVELFIMN